MNRDHSSSTGSGTPVRLMTLAEVVSFVKALIQCGTGSPGKAFTPVH